MICILYARSILDQFIPKLACVIPIKQDFEQILKDIIYPRQLADKYQIIEKTSVHIRDNKSMVVKYSADTQSYRRKAEVGLQLFEAGKTILDIDLPDGLEKLIGKNIISIENSMLLHIYQKQYPSYKFKNTIYTIDELKLMLKEFINEIQKEGLLKLRVENNFLTSKFFRIDVSGGTKDDWKLELQDNTGNFKLRLTAIHRNKLYKDLNLKPNTNNNPEPASSVFAIVKIPKGVNNNNISGKILYRLFSKSLKEGKIVRYNEQLDTKRKFKLHITG